MDAVDVTLEPAAVRPDLGVGGDPCVERADTTQSSQSMVGFRFGSLPLSPLPSSSFQLFAVAFTLTSRCLARVQAPNPDAVETVFTGKVWLSENRREVVHERIEVVIDNGERDAVTLARGDGLLLELSHGSLDRVVECRGLVDLEDCCLAIENAS